MLPGLLIDDGQQSSPSPQLIKGGSAETLVKNTNTKQIPKYVNKDVIFLYVILFPCG